MHPSIFHHAEDSIHACRHRWSRCPLYPTLTSEGAGVDGWQVNFKSLSLLGAVWNASGVPRRELPKV